MSELDLRRCRILIVEDHMPDVVLMKQFFVEQKISNQIRYVGRLRQARDILRREAVDLCLIDANLPDGSGFDLVRELDTGSTTVVMLSGTENMESLLKAQGLGAIAYIAKPLTRKLLDRLVQELKHLHWSLMIEASP